MAYRTKGAVVATDLIAKREPNNYFPIVGKAWPSSPKGISQMAKSRRGSDENLFSISGASEALGRSRRTITRALNGVKPDAVRSGLALWRMQVIIENVNEKTQAPILPTGTAGEHTQLANDAEALGRDPKSGSTWARRAMPDVMVRRDPASGAPCRTTVI
jgi:hypothetical protein